MLSVMATSSRKRFLATTRTDVKNMLNSSGESTHPCLRPCPTTNLSEHSPSSNRHMLACRRGIGGRRRAFSVAHQNEKGHGSVDGVICCSKVDKEQIQEGDYLPCRFLQSSYYEHHVNRRAYGSEPTLFLRQNVLAFAVGPQATRDAFE